eukprot:gene10881-7543_t
MGNTVTKGAGSAQAATKPHSPGQQSFLIVFDFDHTMVDCNTDTVIPECLGRKALQAQLMEEHMQWTALMDTLVAPFTAQELREAAKKSVTIDSDMPEVFNYFRTLRDACGPSLLDINIASDSNLLFIDAALEGCLPGAREVITQIHSNPYEEVVDGAASAPRLDPMIDTEAERDAKYNAQRPRRSRLHWYEQHKCQSCLEGQKPNMCKSRILQRLLHTTRLIDPTIIFIGDGRNDYCTVQHALRPRDYIFARHAFPLHDTLAAQDWGCCHIKLWKNARELLSHFHQVISLAARLPTIVRLRDVDEKEFRSVSIMKRVPDILSRQLEHHRPNMSAAGIRLMEKLIESTRTNGPVPLLPGQTHVPTWMRNYAMTSEFDKPGLSLEESRQLTIAPRWGQMPWLHGEIYLYHLVWQYIMLRDDVVSPSTSSDGAVVNQITPYAMDNPLFTTDCKGLGTNLSEIPATPEETFDTTFLVLDRLQTGVAFGGAADPLPASPQALLPPPGESVLPSTADKTFYPYRDIFASDKTDVTQCFMDKRVVPMVSCKPWKALDEDVFQFLPTMLRWMLWGNAVDLSMFTLEELEGGHTKVSTKRGVAQEDEAQELKRRRHVEEEMMLAMENHVIGNDIAALREYIESLTRGSLPSHARAKAFQTNHIDIVMDNVGVEMVCDLMFGLWFVSHSTSEGRQHPSITFHVKPMPYYVSDVTPPDFAAQLAMLSEAAAGSGAYAGKFSDDERAAVAEMVSLTKEALASGAFKVESDVVWTQPNEYRDLPPRVVNRYFFRQHVSPPDMGDTASPTTPNPNLSGIYLENKLYVDPLTALVLFKGDLNYRRLIGDRHWCRTDFTSALAPSGDAVATMEEKFTAAQRQLVAPLLADTPLEDVMAGPGMGDVVGAYWPTRTMAVASIRTVKSECCVGAAGERKAKLDAEKGVAWRSSGKYGLILLAA